MQRLLRPLGPFQSPKINQGGISRLRLWGKQYTVYTRWNHNTMIWSDAQGEEVLPRALGVGDEWPIRREQAIIPFHPLQEPSKGRSQLSVESPGVQVPKVDRSNPNPEPRGEPWTM